MADKNKQNNQQNTLSMDAGRHTDSRPDRSGDGKGDESDHAARNDTTARHDNSPADISRRNLLKNASLMGAVVAGSGATSAVIAADNPPADTTRVPVREALETLTAAEAATLEAITGRILPADENGPGAVEARAVHYIDRSLASDNAGSRANYGLGLAAIDDYSRQQHGQPFHLLQAEVQDAVLQTVIDGDVPGFNPSGAGFFSMVRSHTIEGTFSDPYYGGNRDFIGWDLLRYPGVRVMATEDDVAQGRALPPNHQSAYDFPNFTKGGGGTGNGR